MTFKRCSIRGQLFGYVFDEHGKENSDDNGRTDEKLIEALESDNEDVKRFFTLLSLCHTVMPEERNGQLFYQAQSPDENALVSAAQAFGYAFQVNRRTVPFSFIPFASESNSQFDNHCSTRRREDRFPSAEHSGFQQRTTTNVSPYRSFSLSSVHLVCLSCR